jgi:hypothetical protein
MRLHRRVIQAKRKEKGMILASRASPHVGALDDGVDDEGKFCGKKLSFDPTFTRWISRQITRTLQVVLKGKHCQEKLYSRSN